MTTFHIIDGYNLLHAQGMIGRQLGPGDLQRARRALLNLVGASLTAEERERAVVVFDAMHAPSDAATEEVVAEVRARYARGRDGADALIEQLIAQASAPKQLIVVSSDHRLQRAAARRGAAFADSDAWIEGLLRRRVVAVRPRAVKEGHRPSRPLPDDEVQRWLAEFALTTEPGAAPLDKESLDEIFPPGYGEDVEREMDD